MGFKGKCTMARKWQLRASNLGYSEDKIPILPLQFVATTMEGLTEYWDAHLLGHFILISTSSLSRLHYISLLPLFSWNTITCNDFLSLRLLQTLKACYHPPNLLTYIKMGHFSGNSFHSSPLLNIIIKFWVNDFFCMYDHTIPSLMPWVLSTATFHMKKQGWRTEVTCLQSLTQLCHCFFSLWPSVSPFYRTSQISYKLQVPQPCSSVGMHSSSCNFSGHAFITLLNTKGKTICLTLNNLAPGGSCEQLEWSVYKRW